MANRPHQQEHEHEHEHEHEAGGHAHVHAPKDFGRAFLVGVILNTGFVLAEAVYGIAANSLALLADAGHNLSDVLGLLLAWGASALVKRAPSQQFTYGLRSTSILAALVNAVLLLVVTGGIAWEAISRFRQPAAIEGMTVIVVAAIGVAINLGTALMFMSGRKGDLNIRGAFLHMAGDAAISLGVVIAGVVILNTGWQWLDPVVSLAIAALVIAGTWSLLRDSVHLALHAVPDGIDSGAVKRYLESIEGVSEVHDLHIWGMSTTETALTAHLVMPGGYPGDAFRNRICEQLHKRFNIGHPTLQVELSDPLEPCKLAPSEVV
ncbi:MAG: cation diffusion facilitator family transporter [Polaromonas sp.]|nr:cation diffusion facilitator family transporter [Polaromonas sp.]